MRIVFAGTPEFAVPSLRAAARHNEVVAVCTQPDRPAGRGRGLQPSPVKLEAVRRGKGTVQGGSTRFEQMSGIIRIAPESIRLTDVSLASGLLKANGMIDIARDGRVAGRLDVEMRGSANLVRMPVVPAGTLRDPVISAGR